MSRIPVALALLLLAPACSRKAETSQAGPTATAAPAEAAVKRPKDPARARTLIAAGATVLDVRTAEEFAEGHVAQATNIPVADLPHRLGEVDALVKADKTRPVVVYCASGHRASQAQQQLEAAGYLQVVNGGGLDDLQ